MSTLYNKYRCDVTITDIHTMNIPQEMLVALYQFSIEILREK